ncbi:protein of unknown function [Taphrina deformans PYCC 5710]|uniref:Uncharacterized protein n=1 Tax=Taphrina deformans (strain PYCC 5710 / ATCC 11124 / CBS 356.35 / IMI 108563 / JCM 9778 / NBRC 8474) TaxID=1097556 RepID=R4X9H5_TAPDE|nr:protein of unknown function [Taphrina deformans PYCC 5710]|eukprot:CCG80874.1 protein of unknown function [Taphrina deformans PYCC 5710]
MKETLRAQAPAAREGTVQDASLAAPIVGTHPSAVKASTHGTAPHVDHHVGSVHSSDPSPSTHGTTTHADHDHDVEAAQGHKGTGATEGESASVKETTGRSDPDVAAQQPKTTAGKTFLEGLGLGGDERQSTIHAPTTTTTTE